MSAVLVRPDGEFPLTEHDHPAGRSVRLARYPILPRLCTRAARYPASAPKTSDPARPDPPPQEPSSSLGLTPVAGPQPYDRVGTGRQARDERAPVDNSAGEWVAMQG